MLNFDDGCDSHLDNAIPELIKRNLIGTFFICPDKPHYKARQSEWETLNTGKGIFFGNHTMTHMGAPNSDALAKELIDCSTYILRVNPPSPSSPLLSYAKPGGKEENWKITDIEHDEIKQMAHVIQRAKSMDNQAGIKVHTVHEMMGLVEKAMHEHTAGSVLFHGVGGDWLSVDFDEFVGFLDLLKKAEDRVWIASHINIVKYAYERDHSKIGSIHASENEIKITLQTDFDIGLYDEPITLITQLPMGWHECSVYCEDVESHASISNHCATYEVMLTQPTSEIILRKL